MRSVPDLKIVIGHKRTNQGAGGLQPSDSVKAIIFRAKAKFFGQKPAAKNEKLTFIKRNKRNSFCLAR